MARLSDFSMKAVQDDARKGRSSAAVIRLVTGRFTPGWVSSSFWVCFSFIRWPASCGWGSTRPRWLAIPANSFLVIRDTSLFTFYQSILSTLLTLALGLPAAFLFARYDFRGKSFLRTLTAIPFMLPTVVVAAGFTALLGPRGWVNLGLMHLFGLATAAGCFYRDAGRHPAGAHFLQHHHCHPDRWQRHRPPRPAPGAGRPDPGREPGAGLPAGHAGRCCARPSWPPRCWSLSSISPVSASSCCWAGRAFPRWKWRSIRRPCRSSTCRWRRCFRSFNCFARWLFPSCTAGSCRERW